MSLTDRLLPVTYADDEQIAFAIQSQDSDPESYVYIPERLVMRLHSLGTAYELHIISMIDPYEDITLNAAQCQTLAAEISFLFSILNDAALLASLRPVMDLLVKIERNSWLGLRVIGS